MAKTFEICFEDLTKEAQQRYVDTVGDEINEFIPLAILEIENPEETVHRKNDKADNEKKMECINLGGGNP